MFAEPSCSITDLNGDDIDNMDDHVVKVSVFIKNISLPVKYDEYLFVLYDDVLEGII